jgi:hypothetical protein
MNWREINNLWHFFAMQHNTCIQYEERNLFHTTKCTYSIQLKIEDTLVNIVGVLWKSQDGINPNNTIITATFKPTLPLKSIEIKSRRFTKRPNTALELSITETLKLINGKYFKLKDNKLHIKLGKILESQTEFDTITSLIRSIKTH